MIIEIKFARKDLEKFLEKLTIESEPIDFYVGFISAGFYSIASFLLGILSWIALFWSFVGAIVLHQIIFHVLNIFKLRAIKKNIRKQYENSMRSNE